MENGNCADTERCADMNDKPCADAYAVARAERFAEKWQRCRNLCRNLCRNCCRTLADAESRADANAETYADARADIRAVFRADSRAVVRAVAYAESGVRLNKYHSVYYYCVKMIQFFSSKVQNDTDAESRAELFAETNAGTMKKSANAVYGAESFAEKFAPMQKVVQIEKAEKS